MATQDTSNEDDQDTSVNDVETDDDSSEDEGTDNGNQDNSSGEDESDDDDDSEEDSEDDESDDDSDDDDDDEEDESEFKKAFSNIKGETPDEYIPNLEEAYRKSSREGKRLSADKKDLQGRIDAINAAVENNPDLKKAIQDATGENAVLPTADPALLKVRADFDKQVADDLEEFTKSHPDLEGDDELVDSFMENVAIVGAAARKKGESLRPLTAYKRAWAMLDHDDSKEQIATAAKNTASKSKSKTSTKSKSSTKPKLSPEQIAVGKKMGLNEKQLLAQLEAEAKE